jgi:adenylate cyclase
MPFEIERKFLVPVEHHGYFVSLSGGNPITQFYLSNDLRGVVRGCISIQPNGDLRSKMTVKSPPRYDGVVREEWEWDMPADTLRNMMESLQPPMLQKTRHFIPYDGEIWEVDVLPISPNDLSRCLVLAEFEAPTYEEVQTVVLPPWVGREVTALEPFAMANLTTEINREAAWRLAYL